MRLLPHKILTLVFFSEACYDFSPHFKLRPSHKPEPTKLSPMALWWDGYKADVSLFKDLLGLKQTPPPTYTHTFLLEEKKILIRFEVMKLLGQLCVLFDNSFYIASH